MPPWTQVIALGQPSAGDDGVGPSVLDVLRETLPATATHQVSLEHATDASQLIDRMSGEGVIVLLDAVTGAGPPGQVLVLSPSDLEKGAMCSVSCHGLSVPQAIELSRALHPGRAAANVKIVAISIAVPNRYSTTLSSEVERAVPEAAKQVHALLSDVADLSPHPAPTESPDA